MKLNNYVCFLTEKNTKFKKQIIGSLNAKSYTVKFVYYINFFYFL